MWIISWLINYIDQMKVAIDRRPVKKNMVGTLVGMKTLFHNLILLFEDLWCPWWGCCYLPGREVNHPWMIIFSFVFSSEKCTYYRIVVSSRPVCYSIFDHFWGAINWDVLLTETCYYCHVQQSMKKTNHN